MAPEFGTPIHHLPLIPADVLKKHRVHEPLDTRFRSAARLLQALWREDQDLPIGSYVSEDGKCRKLGSRISEAAGRGGGNFLTPEIAHTARRETAYREIGALIDAERLATNLLSSMPLTFNLLAPWGHALERASSYLIELLPAFTGAARQLLFEHSPGRGNPKFTGDHTAFDALIRYSDDQGRNGFVAFEPRAVRKYPALSTTFLQGSLSGQIKAVFKSRETTPKKSWTSNWRSRTETAPGICYLCPSPSSPNCKPSVSRSRRQRTKPLVGRPR
jgi:hypothetical protein